jgi:hypothetical protein
LLSFTARKMGGCCTALFMRMIGFGMVEHSTNGPPI